MSTILDLPEERTKEAINQALTLKTQADSYLVANQDQYGAAGDFYKSLREADRKAEEYFKPIKKSFDDGKAIVLAKEKEVRNPIAEAMKIVNGKMNTYLQEQEQIRRDQEKKLREEAEKKAEKDREALLKKAQKAQDTGKAEKAEDLLEKAADVYVAPVYVPQTAPVRTETAHVGTAKQTTVTVTDIKAFVAELVAQNSAMTMIEVKPSLLTAWVKSNGISKFPGLSISVDQVARVR